MNKRARSDLKVNTDLDPYVYGTGYVLDPEHCLMVYICTHPRYRYLVTCTVPICHPLKTKRYSMDLDPSRTEITLANLFFNKKIFLLKFKDFLAKS
jgi:hypothetical protein